MANVSPRSTGGAVFVGIFHLAPTGEVGGMTKQVEVLAVEDGNDWLIITVITRYF